MGETPLLVAARNQNKSACIALVKAGANPGLASDSGTTALFYIKQENRNTGTRSFSNAITKATAARRLTDALLALFSSPALPLHPHDHHLQYY